MFRPVSGTNIEEIATALAKGRDRGQRTVLFLGSRAGGLFGNEFLYDTLKDFSLLDFSTLSNIEKFRESYYVLNKHFTEGERHNILVGALATLTYKEEDKLLAELVKTGFFESIISTNIDTLLEDAYSDCGLHAPDDYRVFRVGLEDSAGIEHDKVGNGYLVKVFGDLDSLRYNITGDFKADDSLQQFLQSKLAGDVLLVGYDPIWDHGLEQAFPLKGKTLRYVDETALPPDTHLAHVLKRRGNKVLQGDQGSYSSFFRSLYYMLGKKVAREKVMPVPESLLSKSPASDTKKVFISCSSEDNSYLERLIIHLKGYMLKDTVDIWDETKIPAGTDWQNGIKESLMQAKVALLLVSSHFLSSARKKELPILLEAASSGDVQFLPIIIDPSTSDDPSASLFDDSNPLNKYQVVNSSSKPLKWMKPYEQELMWNKLAEQVYDILRS